MGFPDYEYNLMVNNPASYIDLIHYAREWGATTIYHRYDDWSGEFRVYDSEGKRYSWYAFGYGVNMSTGERSTRGISVVEGLPSNEYTWVNPVAGNKIVLGWVLIRVS
jgi:hypothetical protein